MRIMNTDKRERFPLQLVSVDLWELIIGLLLIGLSLLMPLFFHVDNFHVLSSLERALLNRERIDLVAASLQLVALNSLRGIPHYVGAYFVGESLSFRYRRRRAWPINAILILVILLLTYGAIAAIHHIYYDFGLPAVLVASFVFFFRKLHYRYIPMWKKAGMIVLVHIALQFLDIMPALDAFPVGRGEISEDIKLAAQVLEGQTALNTVTTVGMILFLTFALLIFFQLRDENNLRELSVLKEENHAITIQAQLNEMKNRTNQEVQYLVHDLKSPLTTVQTLVGVLKMESEMEHRPQDVEYLDYIENAVERMSKMISAILYEDHQFPITTQELVSVVMAQSSVTSYAPYLRLDNRLPEAKILANRLLFPRALVNLLQNSAHAMTDVSEPEIRLLVHPAETPGWIAFTVEDNGTGIDEGRLSSIWDRGTSGHQSSGLGLAFVRNVVEKMGGEIRISSTPGQGTRISLELPEDHGDTD